MGECSRWLKSGGGLHWGGTRCKTRCKNLEIFFIKFFLFYIFFRYIVDIIIT